MTKEEFDNSKEARLPDGRIVQFRGIEYSPSKGYQVIVTDKSCPRWVGYYKIEELQSIQGK